MIELYHNINRNGKINVITDEGEYETEADRIDEALREYWNEHPPSDDYYPVNVHISPDMVLNP